MVDDRLLLRIDWLLALLAVWLLLVLVLGSFALMAVDVAVGVAALAAVVLTAVVTVLSVLRSGGEAPDATPVTR